jgi:hypothetical protein
MDNIPDTELLEELDRRLRLDGMNTKDEFLRKVLLVVSQAIVRNDSWRKLLK